MATVTQIDAHGFVALVVVAAVMVLLAILQCSQLRKGHCRAGQVKTLQLQVQNMHIQQSLNTTASIAKQAQPQLAYSTASAAQQRRPVLDKSRLKVVPVGHRAGQQGMQGHSRALLLRTTG